MLIFSINFCWHLGSLRFISSLASWGNKTRPLFKKLRNLCAFFPLNRSLKRLSVWFQGKNLPTKNRWLERSKPEFNSSFACRFLHYGWSRHGIHTWHGTNKQKCTSQWEFSHSLISLVQKKNRTWKNSCLSFSTTLPLVPWNISSFWSWMQLGQAVPESIVLKELLSPLCAVQAKFYLNCAADICGKKM